MNSMFGMKGLFKVFSLALALGVGLSSAPARAADCPEDWIVLGTAAVGKSFTVTIPEDSEVVYYKLSGVSVGSEYTFTVSGSNAYAEMDATYKYVDSFDTYIESEAIGTGGSEGSASSFTWYVDKRGWEDMREDENGKKEKPLGYYLCLYGDAGSTLSVTSSKGIVTPPKAGTLTVSLKGAPAATWSLKGQTGAYTNGQSIAIMGQQTVVYAKVAGLTTPANEMVTPMSDGEEIAVEGVYSDTFDPKDDAVAGATKLTVSAKAGAAPRTLYEDDAADHFAFTAKDGVYYNFALTNLVGDAALTLFKKGDEESALAAGVTAIAALPLAKGDYILRVAHASAGDATYTLAYSSANVGAIAFAKTAVTAKKSTGSVALAVNRTSAEGKVRVRYGTVNGTAKPGVDYFAQQGELVWENGDKKAKTITVKLIPEAFASNALSRAFSVRLEAVSEEELAAGEYRASITSGKGEATVTVTEAAAKAPAAPKTATVKTEQVPLETGTYQGVVEADLDALTNGFPALASITFTAKDAAKKALSAKVLLGGKTYAFAADAWSEEESTAATAVAALTYVQKVDKTTSLTNTLRVAVARGQTADAGAWTNAAALVELVMNVPDAKGKGYQADVYYAGELFRDNAKIQGYLDAVVEAVGYYTVALAPLDALDAPAGNGYLTLTLDNKGKAKVAGLLADGSTKPSCSSTVAVLDGGETLRVPVYVAKSPYCFGGTLSLVRGADGRYVVDSSAALLWNNDNAALTYAGEEGWQLTLEPVGGYYNTVDNLQAHYLTCALSVETAEADELLAEALLDGYEYVLDIGPNETDVALAGNTLSTEKKSLVKDGKLVDFEQSVNPCNVQVKFTRATGLVSGSFSVWTANEEGTAQKEITGLKHNGILLFSRDEGGSALDAEVLTAGFFTQTATLVEYDDDDRAKKRKYTASFPFNILARDQGEGDWYADDWGERPE